MPKAAKNLHAFDLRMLRSLINLKINGDFAVDLDSHQKESLSKKEHIDGIVNLNAEYISKIWKKGEDISRTVTAKTLNELCKVLGDRYSWSKFVTMVAVYRPENIPFDQSFSELSTFQQVDIESRVIKLFADIKSIQEFDTVMADYNNVLPKIKELKQVIKKVDSHKFLKKNKIGSSSSNIVISRVIEHFKGKTKMLIIFGFTTVLLVVYLFVESKNESAGFEQSLVQGNLDDSSFVKNTFSILLFAFNPIDNCLVQETGIEKAIIARLQEMHDIDNLDLEIRLEISDKLTPSFHYKLTPLS